MTDLKQPFLVLLLSILFSGCNKTDWTENYKEREKSPFGTFILHEEVSTLFKENEVVDLKKNFGDYFYDNDYIDKESLNKTYVLIKDSALKLNDKGITALTKFVKSGNTAFLALNEFPKSLRDKLNFESTDLDLMSTQLKLKKQKGEFQFTQGSSFKTFLFDRTVRRHYFKTYDTSKTELIGTSKIDGESKPNFIKIKYGNGNFYLHSNPISFTNYYLLQPENKSYIKNIFSSIPEQDLLWDLHIRSAARQKTNKNENNKDSIFKFFLEHETLTWALWLSFVALLLFMLFNARRKQRAIPVLEPLKNSTVEFTQNISHLYLEGNDHKNMIDKLTTYFLEQIRSKFLLNTNNLNENFIKNLALKSMRFK